MASTLYELAVNILNDAKISKDGRKKLYFLEQVKEIVLHRDPSILTDVFSDIIGFQSERSVPIRKFLVSFCFEVLKKTLTVCAPALELFSFLIRDGNDSMLRLILTAIIALHDKIIMHIVNLPPKTNAKTKDPQLLWNTWRSILLSLVDIVSSDSAEMTRVSALRLVEVVVLFGLSRPAETSARVLDPRLAMRQQQQQQQQQQGAKTSAVGGAGGAGGGGLSSGGPSGGGAGGVGGGGVSSYNAIDIPLHHVFINRDVLEKEGQEYFAKMLLWASSGGTQGLPFTPLQMGTLGQSIASIGTQRPAVINQASTAIVVMLQGRGSVCPRMSGSCREALARSVHRMVRSYQVLRDDEGFVPKLKAAVATLETLGFTDAAPAVSASGGGGDGGGSTSLLLDGSGAISGVKRDREKEADDSDEELALRQEAINALDEKEQTIRNSLHSSSLDISGSSSSSSSSSSLGGGGSSGAGTSAGGSGGGGGGGGSGGGGGAGTGIECELAGDIDDIVTPRTQQSIRLASVSSVPLAGSRGLTQVLVKTTAPVNTAYEELALDSLIRSLNSYLAFCLAVDCHVNRKKLSFAQALTVRTILSQSGVEMARDSLPGMTSTTWGEPVSVISSLPSASVFSKLAEKVPVDVKLTRSIWLTVSFVMTYLRSLTAASPSSPAANSLLQLTENLLNQLSSRFGSDPHTAPLYEAACLVCVGRLLQNTSTASLAKPLLLSLHRIPLSTIHLLRLLFYTGSKTKQEGDKIRGTSSIAMQLLLQVVLNSRDKQASVAALNVLLWCTVAEDVGIRTKAISALITHILPVVSWAEQAAFTFALQAVCTLVGIDAVIDHLSQLQLEQTSAQIANGQDSEGVSMDVSAAEDTETDNEQDNEGEHSGHRMDVAGEVAGDGAGGEGDEEGIVESDVSLLCAARLYDSGQMFDGSFSHVPLSASARVESHITGYLHFLSQLCVYQPKLLQVYLDLHCVVANESRAVIEEHRGSSESSHSSSSSSSPLPSSTSSASSAESNASGTVIPDDRSKLSILTTKLFEAIRYVCPAAVSHRSPEEVFRCITQVDCDTSFSLLEQIVNCLHLDKQMPASSGMISALRQFIQRNIHKLYLKDDLLLPPPAAPAPAPASATAASATGPAMQSAAPPSTTALCVDGVDYRASKAIRLLVPVLGGFSAEEVEGVLPYLLRSLGSDKEDLRGAFDRIVLARPPPLTRSSLVVAMHRIDHERFGFKQNKAKERRKLLVDCIDLIIANKEFTADVIRDALNKMLQSTSEPLPLTYMRTAIHSAKLHPEVKKFVLSVVIPALVKRRIWIESVDLWEGVKVVVKSMTYPIGPDTEATVRSVLGLGGTQLSDVIKGIKDTPRAMDGIIKVLKALSAEDRAEVLSGRWVGLTSSAVAVTGGESGGVEEEEDQVKKAIVAELMSK